MKSENVVRDKSFALALRIVKLSGYLVKDKKEYVLSKQIMRSGTSIGALIREAEHAESRADFRHKMNIALKEANETLYWLDLLHQSGFLSTGEYQAIFPDAEEVLKMLVSIVKKLKSEN